jgi:hypothetical protein
VAIAATLNPPADCPPLRNNNTFFNNLHEGDWEMIQLTFEGPTVADALTQEPVELGYAQHGGGEISAWNDQKLSKEGDHPVVYVAAGSHAAYYGSDVYLGWGEQRSGVGCDEIDGKTVRMPLQVQLVPDHPDSTGPFAWLTYQGRWGAKDTGVFAGPNGPNVGNKWTEPFSWQDDLRKQSLTLPPHRSIGANPSQLFCEGVGFGANLYTLYEHHAWVTYSIVAFLILVPAVLIYLTHGVLIAALLMFVRHAGLFLALGAVLAGLGIAASQIERLMRGVPLSATLFTVLDLFSPSQFVIRTGSSLQQFVGWTLVTPAVIVAVAEIQSGRRPRVRGAYRESLVHVVTVLKASARAAIVVIALLLSVVGIPWAIAKFVRYLFVAQVVVLEGTDWREARGKSERTVVGYWWRTAAFAFIGWFMLTTFAPVIGIVILIFVTPSVPVANAVSGLIYALLFPLAGIAMTLWYFQRQGQIVVAGVELSVDEQKSPASQAQGQSPEPDSSPASDD